MLLHIFFLIICSEVNIYFTLFVKLFSSFSDVTKSCHATVFVVFLVLKILIMSRAFFWLDISIHLVNRTC